MEISIPDGIQIWMMKKDEQYQPHKSERICLFHAIKETVRDVYDNTRFRLEPTSEFVTCERCRDPNKP